MKKYEDLIIKIAGKLYDTPVVYEIRDRDDAIENIEDQNFIKRSRLECNEVENLIFSNEVLFDLGYASSDEALKTLKNKFTVCHAQNASNHNASVCKICKVINDIANNSFNKKKADLKGSENKIISNLKSDNRLSWEILVGKAIGKNFINKNNLIGKYPVFQTLLFT